MLKVNHALLALKSYSKLSPKEILRLIHIGSWWEEICNVEGKDGEEEGQLSHDETFGAWTAVAFHRVSFLPKADHLPTSLVNIRTPNA